MKIAYLYNDISRSGGIERILTTKMNELSKDKNIDITLITTSKQDNFFHVSERINHINLAIDYSNKQNIFKNLYAHKKALDNLLSNIDIVITVNGIETFLVFFTKYTGKKIRELHFCKNYRFLHAKNKIQKIRAFLLNMIDFYFNKKYDRFIVLTPEDQKNWSKYHNVEQIYNFKTLESTQKSNLDTKKVISVGRLDYQKGFDLLIDSWQSVKEKNQDWTLHIYGDGPEREKLQQKIIDLNLSNNIFLEGKTNNISQKYLESSFYVMSSRHEGMPLVLIEAQEYGLPLVSFSCPSGPSDIIINNENGLLVENGNIQELANKINYLIDNEEVRSEMSGKSSELNQRFDKKIILEEWKNLFVNLLGDSR